MTKKFEGVDIKEVWNFRLSTAVPQINRDGGTWVVAIYAKSNPDYVEGGKPAEPLEVHDTGIPSEPGDHHDVDKVKKCFEWLYSVRDKYALPEIEELKPAVAKIELANSKLVEALAGYRSITEALAGGQS
jgi:hypothetical protein